jgi:hypothetical protein
MRRFGSTLVLAAMVGLAGCKQEAPKAPAANLSFLDTLQTQLSMERADSGAVVSPVELGTPAPPRRR